MPSKILKELPANRAILLKNITCPYCGIDLTSDNGTKEHVIGKRFVPKGKLDGQWNLIVRACRNCNLEKSKLEDDISAITLVGHEWFDSEKSDESVLSEVQRKAKNSISRKTGKPVIHSQEELNVEMSLGGGVTFKFGLVSPPQLDTNRMLELARMQMMAFFYLITFDQNTKKGGFWLDGFYPVSEAHRVDWGNALQKAFMHTVAAWEPRWIGGTADDFFKSIIRRHPHEECWSWALEWNKNYRLVGFFGSLHAAQVTASTFPTLEMMPISTRDKSSLRYREEVRLADGDDLLFFWNDEECSDGLSDNLTNSDCRPQA